MPYLAILRGTTPRVIELQTGEVIAGRARECALELAHPEVSRQHAKFVWDGKCTVTDLGSARGTLVNGQKIQAPTELKPHDLVTLGGVTIEFGDGEPPRIEELAAVPALKAILVHGKPAERIELTGEIILGRDPQSAVVLSDPGVSRQHVRVRPRPGGGCIVEDLKSSGGSFINGHRFDEQELTVGDRLRVGPFEFAYDGQALNRIAQSAGGSINAQGVVFRVGSNVILDTVALGVAPSSFIGIIGPSGAGKSSLLTTLAGLRRPDDGRVLVNGHDLYGDDSHASLGFVPQEDIVHPELRVVDALRFAAKLRLAAGTPEGEIQKLVVQTMDRLGLRQRAENRIANLSGGQRKRVSVGVELLARPAILFLDEPSSGLDPATEFALMELLRRLADNGCTIVCTTHVMDHAYLMDQLVVLCAGHLVYQGPPQAARDHFAVPRLTALYDRLGERPAVQWREAFSPPPIAVPPPAPASGEKTRRAWPLPILLARQWAVFTADWRNLVLLFGQPVIVAVLISWVCTEQPLSLFFATLATLWFGCSNAAQEVVKEVPIYRRERLVGVGTGSYLISKYSFLFAVTAIQAALIYFGIRIGEGGLFGSMGWQIAGVLGAALSSVGIGLAISAIARTIVQAVMLVPLVLIPMILFSGYTIPANEMKPSVYAVSYATPSFASNAIMDTSFLWQQTIARDTLSDYWTSYRNLTCRNPMKTGEIYDRAAPAWTALAIHFAWAIAAFAAAFVALRKKERG